MATTILKNRFLVLKTSRTLQEVIDESRKIGFIFPSPHYFFYKFEPQNKDEEIKLFRGRPLHSPSALMRVPSSESQRSIGILIYSPNGKITHEAYQEVSGVIANLIFELGMDNDWDIRTDEIDGDRTVNVAKIIASVSMIKNPFSYT